MRTILCIVGLAAVVATAVECKRANGAYCDDARPCPNGFACDLTARECHVTTLGGADLAGLSTDMAGCACSGPTPLCVAMQCVSCLATSDGDAACAALSPTTPFCEPSGPVAGSCVNCRNAGDCGGSTPFCDVNSNACRGCIADTECPSLVCDLTPGSTTHGQCVPSSNVVYADPAGSDGDGLTPTNAKHKVQDAMNVAVGLNPARLYVHVAAATYAENVGVNNKTVYLVGATGATIKPSNNDALGSQNNGSLTVRNIIATATSGNAVNCQTNGSLIAYRSQLINSSQLGVYTLNCQLTLDGVAVSGNGSGGISLSGGSFAIINSMITKNGGAGGVTQVTTSATMLFVNNTVADNTAATSTFAGANCLAVGGFTTLNTIFYNNKLAGGAIAETDCDGSFNASDDPSAGPQSSVDLTNGKLPGFVGSGDYHLAAGSPCINQGTTQGAPDHDYDFEPRPDPKSGVVDIGADEVQ